MSVNITVHAAGAPTEPDPFANLESVRKADVDKRRKTRLEQVRQQSKELAAKVRRNFKTAKQKELANVEKIRQEELKRWKQKHIAQLQSQYQHCLEDVGEAHKAAEAAEQCEIWFQEKKAAQQAAALVRGKQAEVKLAEQIQKREDQRAARKRKEYKPSKSVGIQVDSPPQKPLVDQPAPILRTQDDSSSSVNTPSAFEQFRKGPKTKSVPDLRSLSPGFISSDEELLLPYSGKNKENIPSRNSAGTNTLYYNATSFTSPDTLHQHPAQPTKTAPAPLKPFTQVSDFIKRRREIQPSNKTSTYTSQKAVQFDDPSENTLSFPTSTAPNSSILESPRKPARKLLERPRAPPTVTTTTTTSSSKTKSAESTKVQYYDHLTKYRKEYEQPEGLVQRNEKRKEDEGIKGLNAMQEAERHERLQQEMLKARRQPPSKEEDRSRLALEKLQTRKDYENLKAELDKLVKAENVTKSQHPTTKPVAPELRQRQRSATRQKRANDAVEDLIQQRVLITCPRVREAPDNSAPRQRPAQINVAAATTLGKGKLPTGYGEILMDSSDSCSTILLGMDPGGARAGIPLPKEGDKIAKLKELLEQINEQRKLLTEELEREEEEEVEPVKVKLKSTKVQTENGVKQMEKRQEELEEQQRKLHEKEREVRELEKQLKEKMNRLEKEKVKAVAPTVPIRIETEGGVAKVEQETSSNDSVKSGSDIPVKIVITLNDKKQKKVKKTPKKVVPEVRKRKKAVEQVDGVQPETPKPILETPKPKPVQEVIPKPLPEPEQSPISSTTSTIYRQLPPKIDNRIGQLVKQLVQKPEPQPQQPKKPPAPKHQLQKAPPAPKPLENHLNPTLMQYIVRLLGMSRQSIEQLGVSSSTTVSTPHESVVNVSANQSSSVVVEEDPSRMDRLRRFIDDNYNFLSEIDDTLKEQDLTGSANENISRVEDIWMRTLNRKEREIRREKPRTPEVTPKPPPTIGQSPPVKESPLKSILKSPKKQPSKVAKIITPQGHVEVINLSDRDEQEVLQKYSQLTESCSKRISELSEMIQKVREEKKKLIENSLSSTEHQESSTKYMDLPKAPSKTSAETSPKSIHSTKDDPVSEEINRIFTSSAAATRHIGLSKDSGIAMSRPVTSSDYRDSPEQAVALGRPPNAGAPQFESSEDLSSREVPVTRQSQEQFEPLLKDIPKPTARVLTETNEPHQSGESAPHRTKPPVAIRRFSPQLEEATAAHELSTILEVETPLASKTNISLPVSEPQQQLQQPQMQQQQRMDSAEQLLVEARDKLLEHARALGYEGFPNYEEYVRRENLDGTRFDPEKTSLSRLNELLEVTGKSDQLRYQKYPQSAPEMNVTEDTLKRTGSEPGGSNSSSSASLPDVVAELKLRNIIDKSFNNSLDDSNRSTSDDSEAVEIAQPVPQVEKSPSKRKHSKMQDEATESLGRDLNQLGLRWASSMLRKNQEVLNDHSSSSSLSLAEDLLRKKPSTNEASGKPLNLREFIARELMIRTHSDLNSLSDSSSPCSLLLKSLLDISNINTSTPDALTQTTTDKNVQRTSTPVASKSSSGTPKETAGGATGDGSLANLTNGLFSGESRISSVHQSSSSGGENRLSVPTLRLNVDKYRKDQQ